MEGRRGEAGLTLGWACVCTAWNSCRVNGNTTQAVTDLVRAEALRHARPGTEITAVTARFGVPIVSTELENSKDHESKR